MLVGENTMFLPARSALGSVRNRLYMSIANALMDVAAFLASFVLPAERETAAFANSRPASGSPVLAIHGVPAWSAAATQPSVTPPLSVSETGATRYQS